jgi:hypothetical protein
MRRRPGADHRKDAYGDRCCSGHGHHAGTCVHFAIEF